MKKCIMCHTQAMSAIRRISDRLIWRNINACFPKRETVGSILVCWVYTASDARPERSCFFDTTAFVIALITWRGGNLRKRNRWYANTSCHCRMRLLDFRRLNYIPCRLIDLNFYSPIDFPDANLMRPRSNNERSMIRARAMCVRDEILEFER